MRYSLLRFLLCFSVPLPLLSASAAYSQNLLSVLPTFGQSIPIIDPAANKQLSDRTTESLSPEQQRQYDRLLTQPNTGIVRVLPAQNYRPDPDEPSNRLTRIALERFPYMTLGPTPSGMTPRFMLQIEDGSFQIPMSGLNYGFMVNLGDVSLEKVKSTLQNIRNLSREQRQFFLNYVPPDQLEALQQDRLRLSAGKELEALIPSVSAPPTMQAPAVLNNTYLLRSFQFRPPEALLNNQPISREQRRYLYKILRTPSSDVLVAFRPISQHSDGSYTVVWQVLKLFPDPQISDLEKYIELE